MNAFLAMTALALILGIPAGICWNHEYYSFFWLTVIGFTAWSILISYEQEKERKEKESV